MGSALMDEMLSGQWFWLLYQSGSLCNDFDQNEKLLANDRVLNLLKGRKQFLWLLMHAPGLGDPESGPHDVRHV
jgi:hypothetical protein